MRTRNRRWSGGTLISVIGLTAALCIRLWPRDRLLLERATLIPASDASHRWISDHEIIEVEFPDDRRQPPTAVSHDLATGASLHFPIKQCSGYRNMFHFEISPDGRWFLYWLEEGEKVHTVEPRTERELAWLSAGDGRHYENVWLPDSHRWLQLTTLPKGYLTIYNVDTPQKAQRLSFPEYMAARRFDPSWSGYFVTPQDHLLVYDLTKRTGSNQMSQQELKIQEYRLQSPVTLLRTRRLLMSPEQQLWQICFSPSGDRIAYARSESYRSPLLFWVHRWFPGIPASPQERLSIWVADIDGNLPHEIGHMPAPTPDPNVDTDISDLCWLPDGKQLSFVFMRHLYTVSAE